VTTEAKPTPLDYVFERLAATYGAAWDRSLGAAPLNDVKTVWAHQLQPFTQSNAAKRMVVWALDNLPERCPNAIEFSGLCRKAPAVQRVSLPAPPADPARLAAELAKLGEVKARHMDKTDHKAWAKRLQERHAAGEAVNANQIRCYRNALGIAA